MSNIKEKRALLLHMSRVSELSYQVAKKIGLSDEECDEIAIAGHLHDVGKFFVNPAILNKTAKLTDEEVFYVREHVDFSYIVGHLMGNRLTPNILRMIKEHHENNDGTGYPEGKIGDEMLLGSHIIKVCDAYDAMLSDRPYRKKLSKTETLTEILKEVQKYNEKCIQALIEVERIYEMQAVI